MTAQSASSGGDNRDRLYRSGDSTPRRFLEEVVRQTTAIYSVELASDPADLETLRQVAKRFPGAPFQLQPVLVELVRSLLQRQLKSTLQSEEQLTKLADRVAQTLYENPESHARLKELWDRLAVVS
jgi:hypothetical protein